ncbi:hypothetical protein [Hymenobacter weizhouensis]|uniref:hypothetical protein n=1 Tax=Hymenobacter sp. YIM 151500-1 TaxID=2987689 RepID=UPI002227C8A1|nr:hypothetical protein [Hymenobacter sp. YIM 151500-1]UYZ62725.1 hypothetical protein OIS53_17220 [Hymenobacter sp. YIM 151500-1]
MNEHIIVLHSTAGDLLTGRKVSQLAGLAALHGLSLTYEGATEVLSDFVQFTFLDQQSSARLVLVDDYLNNLAYVSLQQMPDSAVKFITDWLRREIGAPSLREVKHLLEQDLEGHAAYVTHLGLLEQVHQSEAGTARLLQRALASPLVEVVEKALIAAQQLRWPELSDDIRRLATHSPNPHLREFAGKVLAQL